MLGQPALETPAALAAALENRTVVLVGPMGVGKTSVGRRLARLLDIEFIDSDHEIEAVSRMSVPELFAAFGEPEFRALEHRVVCRLVANGPAVVATGGGAFMNAGTRAAIREHGVSVWLDADLDTLMERVSKRADRPLLKAPDPRAVMQRLIEERNPVYAEADLKVASRDGRHTTVANDIMTALSDHLKTRSSPQDQAR